MTWFTPMLLTTDFSSGARPSLTTHSPDAGTARGLGTAQASGQWAWSATPARPTGEAPAERTPTRATTAREGACLRAPVELLSQMSEAARALGRSESEVWVEAAREWLRRREGEPGAPPAAAAQMAGPLAGPITVARRIPRGWDEIDALLIALRAPASPRAEREGVPAA